MGETPIISLLAQEWRIIMNPNGSYRLFHVNTAYAIEAKYGTEQAAEDIIAQHYLGYANQQWEFIPVAENITIKAPTSSSIGYIRNYHEYFKEHGGDGLSGAQNAELTSIILDLDSPYSSKQSSVTLQAEFTPENSMGSVVWSSSNTDVATVNPNTGLVTAVGHGRAIITAQCVQNNSSVDSIAVIVPDVLMDVDLDLQEKDQWCWVTSVRMIMKYYFPEITASQQDAVVHVKGSAVNEPGNNTESKNAAIYYSNNRVEYHSIAFPDEDTLRGLLDDGIPLYLSERWTKDGETKGHARVIYGYYQHESGDYVYLVHDPYQWVKRNIRIKTQMSYTNLCNEQQIGIPGIDEKAVISNQWAPGTMLYWTVQTEGG